MTIFSIRAKKQAQTLLERFYGQFPKIIDFQWNFTMGRLSLMKINYVLEFQQKTIKLLHLV